MPDLNASNPFVVAGVIGMGLGMFVISVLSGWKLLAGPLGLTKMQASVPGLDGEFRQLEQRIEARLDRTQAELNHRWEHGRDEIDRRLTTFADITRDLQNVTRDIQRQVDTLYRGRTQR